MRAEDVVRDERTLAVENASFRLGYMVLTFGILAAVAYRAFVRGESSWDLLGLVIVSGLITTVFQGRRGVLTRRWAWTVLGAAALAAVLAAALAYLA